MNTTRLPSLFAPEPFTFDDAFRSFMRPFRWEPALDAPQMRFDVTEVEDAYVVMAEIPGVTKDAIHVEIEGAQVMISAEIKRDVPAKKELRTLHSERRYGYTSRVFTLGFEIDRARAVAKYVDGVLTLTLPKKASVNAEPLIVQ